MKTLLSRKAVIAISFLLSLFSLKVQAQTNLGGVYTDTGYFFHPSSPRAINQLKTVIQVDSRTYQIAFGDWAAANYSFQFQVDSNNNLVNWIPLY